MDDFFIKSETRNAGYTIDSVKTKKKAGRLIPFLAGILLLTGLSACNRQIPLAGVKMAPTIHIASQPGEVWATNSAQSVTVNLFSRVFPRHEMVKFNLFIPPNTFTNIHLSSTSNSSSQYVVTFTVGRAEHSPDIVIESNTIISFSCYGSEQSKVRVYVDDTNR